MSGALAISTFDAVGALGLRLEGELDLQTVPQLEEALIAAEASATQTIVLDIDGLSFIDSSGLHALLAAHARSKADGDRLRITRGTAQAQRLFALVRADAQLPFIDAVADPAGGG